MRGGVSGKRVVPLTTTNHTELFTIRISVYIKERLLDDFIKSDLRVSKVVVVQLTKGIRLRS